MNPETDNLNNQPQVEPVGTESLLPVETKHKSLVYLPGVLLFCLLLTLVAYAMHPFSKEEATEYDTNSQKNIVATENAGTSTESVLKPRIRVLFTATSTHTAAILNTINDVVYYSVEEAEVSQPDVNYGRGFRVVGLYKKTGESDPVKFATVGGLHEYPSSFAVSPDKKKIAVNLESRLALIDAETGAQETLFTPRFVIGGRVAFSPDSTHIAFVDGNDYVQSDFTSLYTLNLSTKEVSTEIERAENHLFADVEAWRPDNTLVLSYTAPKGCAVPKNTLFELTTKKLITEPAFALGTRNSDGAFIDTYVSHSISSARAAVCEKVDAGMCGAAGEYSLPTTLEVSDPLTHKVLGEIGGDPKRTTSLIALAPDKSAGLYSSRPLPSTQAQCENRSYGSIFYVKNFKSGRVETISDLGIQLGIWGITLRKSAADISILTESLIDRYNYSP